MLHLSDDLLQLLGEKDKRYQLFTAPVDQYATSFAADGGRLYYQDIAMSYRNVGPSVPEMMLIKAEYYARNNQPTEAMQWVNKLRVKRFAAEDYTEETATDADDALKKVIDERHREFFCRNLRWYDLRRWGKTAEALTAAGRTGFDKSKLFYPTPLTELNSNSLAK